MGENLAKFLDEQHDTYASAMNNFCGGLLPLFERLESEVAGNYYEPDAQQFIFIIKQAALLKLKPMVKTLKGEGDTL